MPRGSTGPVYVPVHGGDLLTVGELHSVTVRRRSYVGQSVRIRYRDVIAAGSVVGGDVRDVAAGFYFVS